MYTIEKPDNLRIMASLYILFALRINIVEFLGIKCVKKFHPREKRILEEDRKRLKSPISWANVHKFRLCLSLHSVQWTASNGRL